LQGRLTAEAAENGGGDDTRYRILLEYGTSSYFLLTLGKTASDGLQGRLTAEAAENGGGDDTRYRIGTA
jgi:hypothetical protein